MAVLGGLAGAGPGPDIPLPKLFKGTHPHVGMDQMPKESVKKHIGPAPSNMRQASEIKKDYMKVWRPVGDSNPCSQRERLVS